MAGGEAQARQLLGGEFGEPLRDIQEPLGTMYKKGVLRSEATRAAFLSDAGHRIRFHFTPKHCSWLNQIELFFSVIARRLLRRGSFVSLEDLRARVLAFIQHYNQRWARPYGWTFTGRPLDAQQQAGPARPKGLPEPALAVRSLLSLVRLGLGIGSTESASILLPRARGRRHVKCSRIVLQSDL